MRRVLACIAIALPFALIALPASAVGYEVVIENPHGAVGGTAVVEARASGGVGDAEHAAYHVRSTGTWVDAAAIPMEPAGEGRFLSGAYPWDTTLFPNGRYDLEVRIWGEVPPYDPGEPNTFARRVVSVAVDNPPPVPAGLQGTTGAPAVRLAWEPVPTSDRDDFLGYRVFRKGGSSCGGGGYSPVGDVTEATFASDDTSAGTYCYRVAAARTSPVSQVILSVPSPPVRVEVVTTGAVGNIPALVAGPGDAVPPAPPALGEGSLRISDGGFGRNLPYDGRTVTEVLNQEGAEEAGPDPRRNPFLIGGGVVLTAAGVALLRRVLVAPNA